MGLESFGARLCKTGTFHLAFLDTRIVRRLSGALLFRRLGAAVLPERDPPPESAAVESPRYRHHLHRVSRRGRLEALSQTVRRLRGGGELYSNLTIPYITYFENYT